MRRIAFLFLGFWVSMTIVLASSPGVIYESSETDLTYRYVYQEEGSKAEFWTYRFRTELGRLQLTIRSEEDRYTVTSDLEGAPSREEVMLSAPTGSGEGEIELSWPDLRRQVRYVKYESADELECLVGRPLDCEALVNGELARTKRDLLARVNQDFVRYVQPPRHLEELAAGLHAARFLPLVAGECEETQDPAGGACYYDNVGYIDCLKCCHVYGGISSSVCVTAFGRICRSGWCLGLSGRICGGAVEIAGDICSLHNCRGKSGDPWCDANQPCEGQCINFCGPGWSSGCGHCDDSGPDQQACCH